MNHMRSHSYIDERTKLHYHLKVHSEAQHDWEIQIFDRHGKYKETISPPRAFNFIPISIRRMMRIDLKKFQFNISAEKHLLLG